MHVYCRFDDTMDIMSTKKGSFVQKAQKFCMYSGRQMKLQLIDDHVNDENPTFESLSTYLYIYITPNSATVKTLP